MSEMYSPEKLADIVTALIKGYKQKYDRFLDERRTEWARRVEEQFRKEPVDSENPAASKNPAARKRLQLMKHIICESEKYCRRDMEIPELEFEQQMNRIEELVNLRAQVGKTEPHPTILSEKANLLMLKGEYGHAQNELDQAIKLNEQLEELIAKRDNICLLANYVRCLYMQKEFDTAIEKADQTRRLASEVSIDSEEDEWMKYAAAPGLQFIPAAVHAYFAACDARVNHERWDTNEQLSREFTGLWNDAVTKYNVPHVWRTPMKIAVASDKMWVSRMESYVQDIAEKLYVELAGNSTVRIIRLIRSKWGGFKIDYTRYRPSPITSASIILSLCIINLSITNSEASPGTSAISPAAIERVLKEGGVQADPDMVNTTVISILGSDSVRTPKDFKDVMFQDEGFEITPDSLPILHIASSGSESSVNRL